MSTSGRAVKRRPAHLRLDVRAFCILLIPVFIYQEVKTDMRQVIAFSASILIASAVAAVAADLTASSPLLIHIKVVS